MDKEFSVAEISSKIKELLENNFGYIRVKGEISGLKIATSGHGYFNLKENTAILACTCWRSALGKINFTPVDGMEVTAIGKLSGYAGNSRYQLSVEVLEPVGLGAIMQILKERQERLEKEGLFNKPKKPIPFLPDRIGVVTSITGAVIKDIIHRINDRCPSHILLWPVTVQGETAANEIALAIEGFNQLAWDIKPDIIIVARGGGSIEDLWAFNEEIVVRSAFNSDIPIISAVGHEVDHTLIDLVADKRAPTPTAAAEFAVPVLDNLSYTINSYYNSLYSQISQFIKYQQQIVKVNTDIVKNITAYMNYNQQLLDELSIRLMETLNPLKLIYFHTLELGHQFNYTLKSIATKLKNCEYQLNLHNSLLNTLDYKTVLKRGFAIIKSEDGKCITSKIVASEKQKLNIKFSDGDIVVYPQSK